MEIRSSKQLYNKLLLIYTSIIIGVVSALVFYFLSSTKNRYLEENLDYTRLMNEEAVAYLEGVQDTARVIHENLYKSNTELDDLLHYLNCDAEQYQQYRLDAYMKSSDIEYKGMDTFVKDIFDTYKNLKRVAFFSYGQGELTAYSGKRELYREHAGEESRARIESGNLAEPGGFSFLKEIRDPYTMQSAGCMILTFDGERFATIWQYYSRAQMLVYNDSAAVIFASADRFDIRKIMEADRPEEVEEVLGAYVEEKEVGSYRIISYLDRKEAARVPMSRTCMIIGVGIVLAAAGEIFVRWYLKRLAGRLNRILNGMTEVMSGDLRVRIPVDRNGDELDVIAKHFNEMCGKLDEHIQKRYLAEIEQKNAEMAALQSQINPHFLYNTLEAIRMKAVCNGDREVGKMLYSMAVTFRSQIKEADVITMAQELHYCKKYLELFEYRYQGQFQSSVECPGEYLTVPIIKFVIQPIIENYFIHGIRMGEKDNHIRIIVDQVDEVYRMIVEDNGRGMTRGEIAAKNKELEANEMKKNASIGIANVNRRVKAVYGKEYGIRIEENPQGGLRVILRFRPNEEEGQDEESNDSGR